MKTSFIKRSLWSVLLTVLIAVLVLSQDSTGKKSLSLNLAFHQSGNEAPVLHVSTKTKIEKKFRPVGDVKVNLFFGEESSAGFMEQITTNKAGEAKLVLPDRFLKTWEEKPGALFLATVTGNKEFEDASTETEITKAKIELSLKNVDSIRTIEARVFSRTDSGWVPSPEIEIKLMVRGYFKDLPISEETYTTDSTGAVHAEFSLNMPGDKSGKLTLVARIEENDVFGNIATYQSANWGTPLLTDHSFEERTLWTTRDKTPLWLLIFPNLIIAGVWGMIFYLLILIVRIRSIGKA